MVRLIRRVRARRASCSPTPSPAAQAPLLEPLEPRRLLSAGVLSPACDLHAAPTVALAADVVAQAVDGDTFGKDSPGGNASLVALDDDGTRVTFTLKGPGVGTLSGGDGSEAFGLSFTGTTPASKVTVKVRGGTDPEAFLNNVTVDGSLKSFVAKNVNLDGDFTVGGVLLKLLVDDFNEVSLDQHTVTIGGAGAGPRDQASLTFDALFDATIVSAIPIKKFLADDWIDFDDGAVPDSLTAPAMTSFTVRGDRRDNEDGDLEADITLTDAASVLKKFRVKNDIIEAVVRTAGDINSFVAGGLLESTLFAGVAAEAPAGALPIAEQIGTKTIKSFKVSSPFLNVFAPASLRDSVVAAANLGKVKIEDVGEGAADGPFGFAALTVKSYRSDNVRLKANQLETPGDYDPAGSYVLRVLPLVV